MIDDLDPPGRARTSLVRLDTAFIDPAGSHHGSGVPAVALREPCDVIAARSQPLGTVTFTAPSGASRLYRATADRPRRAAAGRNDVDALVADLQRQHLTLDAERRSTGQPAGFRAGLDMLEVLRRDGRGAAPFALGTTQASPPRNAG